MIEKKFIVETQKWSSFVGYGRCISWLEERYGKGRKEEIPKRYLIGKEIKFDNPNLEDKSAILILRGNGKKVKEITSYLREKDGDLYNLKEI